VTDETETKDIYNHCLKCGFCLNSCPVYKELKDEIISPRGKLKQIKSFAEGQKVSESKLKKVLSNCLMCGSCLKNCPSGLKTPFAIQTLRAEFQKKYGHDWMKRLMKYVMNNNNLRSMSAAWAKIVYNNFIGMMPIDIPAGAISIKTLPKLASPVRSKKLSFNGVKKYFIL
jgi:glycolate oxidase iron-sulfur subunit